MTGKYPLFLALISCFLFTTCKKGPNDPAISLLTRKARLAGDWRLQTGSASINSWGYSDSYTFDGSTMQEIVSGYPPQTYTGIYSLNLSISKNGTFTFKENYVGAILSGSGTWNFNNGIGDDKKKEDVIFSIDHIDQGYTEDNLFNRAGTHFEYQITELKSKEMVIHSDGKIYSNVQGEYITLSTDYTFQQ